MSVSRGLFVLDQRRVGRCGNAPVTTPPHTLTMDLYRPIKIVDQCHVLLTVTLRISSRLSIDDFFLLLHDNTFDTSIIHAARIRASNTDIFVSNDSRESIASIDRTASLRSDTAACSRVNSVYRELRKMGLVENDVLASRTTRAN